MSTKSFLNPLITIPIGELENLADKFVPQVLFDNSVGNGTLIRATKEGQVKFTMEFNRVLYRVPVRLQVKKDIGISTVQTDCKIMMQFKTVFEISPDWSVKTKTELQQYGWLKKPQLDLGFLSVPIVTVLEGVLHAKQDLICEAIDSQTRNLNLGPQLQTILASLPNPLNLPMIGSLYWQSSEIVSTLHPLEVSQNKLQVTFGLESDIKLGIGAPIPKLPLQIKAPNFTKNKRSPSRFRLKTSTAISTIETLFNKEFSGQSYAVEQFNLKPTNIVISCDGKRMTLSCLLEGSFTGKVSLHGIPFFNPEDRTLYCRDVEIELEGAGLKSKSIVVLASKLIKKKIEENLKVPVDLLVQEINKHINRYDTGMGILKAYIVEYKLSNLKMATESIDVDVDVDALVSFEAKLS